MVCFKYDVFTENTRDNIEWLEKLGYHIYNNQADFLSTKAKYALAETTQSYMKILTPVTNCIYNLPLFKALTAVRDDSDYMQWFTDGEKWILCTSFSFKQYLVDTDFFKTVTFEDYHKATLEELHERFKIVRYEKIRRRNKG